MNKKLRIAFNWISSWKMTGKSKVTTTALVAQADP